MVSAVCYGDGSLLAEARFQVLGGRQPTETPPSLRADGVPIACLQDRSITVTSGAMLRSRAPRKST